MRNINELKIIFENDDFLAVNKPTGMLVHEARIRNQEFPPKADHPLAERIRNNGDAESETLVNWLLKKYPAIKKIGDDPKTRPGIVHRLDKDTSGVMLIPKTQEYFLYLKRLFQEHKIEKTYLAVVCGVLKEEQGTINKPIGIKDGTIKRSVYSKKMAKEAVTEYKVIRSVKLLIDRAGFGLHLRKLAASLKNQRESLIVSLLEVTPQTGRTHQIRIHLSSIGHPILGDALYGNKHSIAMSKELNINHQMLHAFAIEFKDKPAKKIRIEAEPPEEFGRFIDKH